MKFHLLGTSVDGLGRLRGGSDDLDNGFFRDPGGIGAHALADSLALEEGGLDCGHGLADNHEGHVSLRTRVVDSATYADLLLVVLLPDVLDADVFAGEAELWVALRPVDGEVSEEVS